MQWVGTMVGAMQARKPEFKSPVLTLKNQEELGNLGMPLTAQLGSKTGGC